MEVEVTQADIDGATYGATNCPIARAVKRITSWPHLVSASAIFVYLHDENGIRVERAFSPQVDAIDFMDHFDAGNVVAPDTFTLIEVDMSAVTGGTCDRLPGRSYQRMH